MNNPLHTQNEIESDWNGMKPSNGEAANSRCPASAGSVLTLRFNDGTERDYTEEDFNKLKSTGMLWEFHHDAPMKFTPNSQRCHGKAVDIRES